MTARLFALDGGTYYHKEALRGPRYARYFSALIDLRTLPDVDLSNCDVLIVTCRSHPAKLRASRTLFADFLGKGGTVVAMGETQSHTWLPGVQWSYRPANFWWWLDKSADHGYITSAPEHPLFGYISLADTIWHYHGILTPPPGAQSLIDLESGGSLLYQDETSAAGRMIVTTLDPFFHHGSHFMPATTRFLDGFLPWLAQLALAKPARHHHPTTESRQPS